MAEVNQGGITYHFGGKEGLYRAVLEAVRDRVGATPLLDAAKAMGARVWVISEYGHSDVSRPVLINQALRRAGLLSVRPGPSPRPPRSIRPPRSPRRPSPRGLP